MNLKILAPNTHNLILVPKNNVIPRQCLNKIGALLQHLKHPAISNKLNLNAFVAHHSPRFHIRSITPIFARCKTPTKKNMNFVF